MSESILCIITGHIRNKDNLKSIIRFFRKNKNKNFIVSMCLRPEQGNSNDEFGFKWIKEFALILLEERNIVDCFIIYQDNYKFSCFRTTW